MLEGFVLGLLIRIAPALALCCVLPSGSAQEMARSVPAARSGEEIPELSMEAEDRVLPRELKAESAIYLQRRLGEWTANDARRLLGDPSRRRDAYAEGAVTGDIFAFRDPTARYREFELLFDRRTRKLTTIFIYPWHMTWQDCRELWGEQVNTTRMANGNTFRAYRDRSLDVLADGNDVVINLGVY